MSERPEREMVFRAYTPDFELRTDTESGMPTLVGHFTPFNRWTEINSHYEGRFLERMAPGAFKKTFRENGSQIKVLFQHGMDPQVGDKPLGPIRSLQEDEVGARYEVELLDTTYNRDLIPGLKAGLYGASFRFQVIREDVVQDPGASEHNPLGLPERTVKEARVAEFGPVTFPAYADASAAVRSGSDYILDLLLRSPERTKELVERRMRPVSDEQPVEEAPAEAPEAEERRDDDATAPSEPVEDEQERRDTPTATAPAPKATRKAARKRLTTRKDRPSWLIGP